MCYNLMYEYLYSSSVVNSLSSVLKCTPSVVLEALRAKDDSIRYNINLLCVELFESTLLGRSPKQRDKQYRAIPAKLLSKTLEVLSTSGARCDWDRVAIATASTDWGLFRAQKELTEKLDEKLKATEHQRCNAS